MVRLRPSAGSGLRSPLVLRQFGYAHCLLLIGLLVVGMMVSGSVYAGEVNSLVDKLVEKKVFTADDLRKKCF